MGKRTLPLLTFILIPLVFLVSCSCGAKVPLSDAVATNPTGATTTATAQTTGTTSPAATTTATTAPVPATTTTATSPSATATATTTTATATATATAATTTTTATPAPEPPGELLAEQHVTAAEGGTVTADGGRVTLDFPAGSLPEDRDIQVRALSEEEIPEDARGLETVGKVYNFEPDGLVLDEPATLTIKLSVWDLEGLDVPPNHYPTFLVLTRDHEGNWDITQDMHLTVDILTGTLTISTQISHFSGAYTTDTCFSVGITPKQVNANPGASWYASVEVTNTDNGITVIFGETNYYAYPSSVVIVQGPTTGEAMTLGPGASKKVTPDPLYVCVGEGDGSYGAGLKYHFDSTSVQNGVASAFFDALEGLLDQPSFTFEPSYIAVHGICKGYVCFAGDTPVLMADGTSRNIQDIRVGETVTAYDTATGEVVAGTVTAASHGEADHYYLINGAIRVTPPHPFYTADGRWVKIEDLKAGDAVFGLDGPVVITSIERVDAPLEIFNISVGGYGNFFVSADGVTWLLVKEGP